MTLPLRIRLALWYGGLMAIAMIVFSIVVYVITDRSLDSNFNAHLRERASHAATVVSLVSGRPAMPRGEEQTDDPSAPAIIFDRSGHVSTGDLTPQVHRWLGIRPLRKLTVSGLAHSEGLSLYTVPVVRRNHTVGYVLIWQPVRGLDDARHALLLVLLLACPLLVIAASGGGALLAGRALRPVTQVAEVASTISVTDLHRRVPHEQAQDELGALATAFNAMIARLEAAVGREHRFTADASHELRSPLSVIRAEATLALDRPRSAERYRHALEAIDHQAVTMEGLIDRMLLLARTESLAPEDRLPVRLATVVQDAQEQVATEQHARGITVHVDIDPALSVLGSGPLLTQAVRNVIHNAIKASPEDGVVEIHATQQSRDVVLTITDHGSGIAAEHLGSVFEPFYQVDSARTPGQSHGLGLAIVSRIVTAHGGQVEIQSEPGSGTRCMLTLPLANTAARTTDSSPESTLQPLPNAGV